jgi:uncharacterized membrane protein YeaQ/YmgE (transglycosylase-associated protein family)
MHILFWIIVGAIAGMLAKAVMPGTRNEPGGFFMTMVLGIVGALLGGWLFQTFLGHSYSGWVGSTIVAFVGACVVIGLLRLISGSSSRATY